MELIAEFDPEILYKYPENKHAQIVSKFILELSTGILKRKRHLRIYIEEVKNTDEEINKMIGKSIKNLRKSAHMTQEELGKKLNMSHANISDIEAGKTKLTVDNLLLMQIIFHTEIKDFINTKKERN